MGSMSSMEVNIDMLEQMDLMDASDQEALDVFLNSGEDSAVLSPVSGRRQACTNFIILAHLIHRHHARALKLPVHLLCSATWPPKPGLGLGRGDTGCPVTNLSRS